jgi:cobalt-zinc-cadmium efflux system protein
VAHTHQAAPRSANKRRLKIALALAAIYMLAEVAGGVLTGSLALLADAGHMLGDVGALALSLFALWIADRPSSTRFTFGYYRTEILAALVNGAALLAIAAMILLEAVERLSAPPPVAGAGMLAIATGGLVVNLVALVILGGGRHESLNLRGAWLHVASDALVALLRDAGAVLMEGAPGHLDVDQIRDALVDLECVHAIHDLHVWTITSGVVSGDRRAERDPRGAARSLRHRPRDRAGGDRRHGEAPGVRVAGLRAAAAAAANGRSPTTPGVACRSRVAILSRAAGGPRRV